MKKNLINDLCNQKVMPIIRNSDSNKVLDIAKALSDGGIDILEVNIINSSICKVIEKISEFSTVCAAGIITQIQAEAAINSGAEIISSPIFSINLVKLSKDKEIPLISGTSTANEAYNAWKARVPMIKIYPITAMGGVSYIENVLRPMPFLNLMPLGNVKLSEIKSYINAGAKVVGVGRDFYEGYSYSEIIKRTENIIKDLKEWKKN